MADLADVEVALAAAVDAVRAELGAGWSIYRGWPLTDALDREMARGDVHVTVTPRDGFTRDTTRYAPAEVELPRVPPTLTVMLNGQVATFAGTCSVDQIAGVEVGTTAWDIRCSGTDTPATVAAKLAALSGGTAQGAALTLPGIVAARTARDGGTLRATRQTQQGFAISVWASIPEDRDAVAGAIDAALSDTQFLALADGSYGHLMYAGVRVTDKSENANIYRRDLYYLIDYATTIAASRTPVLFQGAHLNTTPIGALASP